MYVSTASVVMFFGKSRLETCSRKQSVCKFYSRSYALVASTSTDVRRKRWKSNEIDWPSEDPSHHFTPLTWAPDCEASSELGSTRHLCLSRAPFLVQPICVSSQHSLMIHTGWCGKFTRTLGKSPVTIPCRIIPCFLQASWHTRARSFRRRSWKNPLTASCNLI